MDVVATNEEMDPEAEDPQAVEDRLQKEREIWESFREEHFEGTQRDSAASLELNCFQWSNRCR